MYSRRIADGSDRSEPSHASGLRIRATPPMMALTSANKFGAIELRHCGNLIAGRDTCPDNLHTESGGRGVTTARVVVGGRNGLRNES